MKKLLVSFFIVLLSTPSFAQENNQLLEIKSNLLVNAELSEVNLPQESFRKKSPGLAILYSMLLPGMGELYAGDYSTGKYFTIADGIIWGVFTGITIYGNDKEDSYRAYAQAYGNVNLDGKDETYFADISIYENIDQFNTEKELNREFENVYNENSHYWAWDGSSQRKEYRALWSSSETAKNNVRFAAGALILNRIVSSIFAVRAVSAYNKRESTTLSWNVNFGVQQNQNLPTSLIMNFNYDL
jgi:Family of unknown function (DUF5683)